MSMSSRVSRVLRIARGAVGIVSVLGGGVLAGGAVVAGLGACGSDEAGATPPGGEPAPLAPPTSTTPDADGGGVPGADAGPVTTVRVHYKGRPGEIGLRGAAAPLSWDVSVALAAATSDPALYTWSTPGLTGEIEIKPTLDTTWSRGPNYRVKAGETVDIYPHFVEQKGTVDRRYPAFSSTKLPSTRGILLYLPPVYVENEAARLGVLYMHDGQNLFQPETSFAGVEWKVDETMDAASEDGTVREVIVVGVENTPQRVDELTPTLDPGVGSGGKGDLYLSMLVDEIKPRIDADLRTLPTREKTAIMGSSLGGLISVYAGVKRADVFGLVGAMSPSVWWDSTMILGQVSGIAATPTAPRPLRVYIDSGDSGASNDDAFNVGELAKTYRGVGYVDGADFRHVIQAGAEHNESFWAARLPQALSFLLGPRDGT